MRENRVRELWQADRAAVGGWLSVGHPYTAELMGSLGFDWVCLDLQHGAADSADLLTVLPAVSATAAVPFVRVAWNAPEDIMRALDLGAYGVIVPMVSSAEEAERAVAACRYPPRGERSFGPVRAALYGGSGYARGADETIICAAMIETAAALENLDEILAVPGLDAVYVGPSDLGLALGLGAAGDSDHPEHVAAVERILVACRRHGVVAGIHTSSLAFTRRWIRAGFRLVTLGADAGFLARAASQDLRTLREEEGES